MDKNYNSLAIFESFKIRRHYNEKTEKWYFSVIDIISILTGQTNFKRSQSYWTTLKNRLRYEGSELVTKCDKLKMLFFLSLREPFNLLRARGNLSLKIISLYLLATTSGLLRCASQ